MKRKTTLLVMAAGMGSRFGSLKQITPLGPHQKALLHYTIYDAVHAGFDKIVFVIRESFAKEFIDFVGKYAEGLVETAYCYQSMDKLPGGMPPIEREKPWGTAHAIWSAKEVIDEPFAALNADDFYQKFILEEVRAGVFRSRFISSLLAIISGDLLESPQ